MCAFHLSVHLQCFTDMKVPRNLLPALLVGYKLSKGTKVVSSIYAVHHNEDVWPDPESYRPERHLHGATHADGAATQPNAWLAFGAYLTHTCVIISPNEAMMHACIWIAYFYGKCATGHMLAASIMLKCGSADLHQRIPRPGIPSLLMIGLKNVTSTMCARS